MLVASLLGHSWPGLFLIIFNSFLWIGKHLVRGKAQSWVSLSKSNIFFGFSKI